MPIKILALIQNTPQCRSLPDQGISKTFVKTVNVLQVAAALHSQNIKCSSQVLPLVDFLELLMTNADQCQIILSDTDTNQCRSILLDEALIGTDRQ